MLGITGPLSLKSSNQEVALMKPGGWGRAWITLAERIGEERSIKFQLCVKKKCGAEKGMPGRTDRRHRCE